MGDTETNTKENKPKNSGFKKRVFEVIDIAKKGDIKSRTFDLFIIALIVLNIVCIIVETYDITTEVRTFCERFEIISCVIFTIEYILRVWTSDILYNMKGNFVPRMKYMLSVNGMIELLSILPFYLPMFIPSGLIVFRSLRLVRIFRLFKVSRYSDAISLITNVIKSRANQLMSSVFIISVLMLASSVLMYNIENPTQPEVFKNAFSGIWWATNAIATVGYGDIYPVTSLGRLVSIIITFLGIGLIAIPTGIVSAGFIEQTDRLKVAKMNEEKENLKEQANASNATAVKEIICPCCNEKIKIK